MTKKEKADAGDVAAEKVFAADLSSPRKNLQKGSPKEKANEDTRKQVLPKVDRPNRNKILRARRDRDPAMHQVYQGDNHLTKKVDNHERGTSNPMIRHTTSQVPRT